jgi:hypothetical protein
MLHVKFASPATKKSGSPAARTVTPACGNGLQKVTERQIPTAVFRCLPAFLFCGILLCACTRRESFSSYRTFPEVIALHGEAVPLDTALLRYPFRIAVREGIAVVMDLHPADHYLHAFTCPGGKHIASFGRRGEGPEELLSAETFRFLSLDSLWVLDANRMEITRWRIFLDGQTVRREETVHLDKSLIRSLDFRVTETGFVLPDYSGEHRYHLVDFSGQPVRAVGQIPAGDDADRTSPIALAQAWRSFFDCHPRHDLLAMVTQLGEVLELYHLNDTARTAVIHGPHGEPEFRTVEGESIPTGIMGFGDIQITDRYIYTVFQGRTFKEIQQAYQQGQQPERGGRSIYVFDLEGRPVRQYTPDHSVSGIYVDEQAGVIFATDVNSDEPVVQFSMRQ